MSVLGVWGVTVILGVVLTITSASFGSDRQGRTPEPLWAELERELIREEVGTDVVSLIKAVRSHPGLGVRWMATEVLGLRGEKQAKEALLQTMNFDKELLVRETAALALARLGDRTGLVALKKFMETSTNPHRQLSLAARLAELGDPSGYPHITKWITSERTHLRYLAVAGLVAFIPFQGVREGAVIDPVERLLALAGDKDPKVRKEVLIQSSLAVYKGVSINRFKPIVEKMASSDTDPEVREAARLLLVLWQ